MTMQSRKKRNTEARRESFQEEIAEECNFEQRTLAVLILDASGSMAGDIEEENQAMKLFAANLQENSVAAKRIRMAIIEVGGGVRVVVPFTDAEEFSPPTLKARGDTPFAKAVIEAYSLIEEEKKRLTADGIDFNKTAVIALGDFGATDNSELIDQACNLVRRAETTLKRQDAVAFFPFATECANEVLLERIASRGIRRMKGNRFDEFFRWVAASLNSMSMSMPGDRVELSDPMTEGWATL